jgi:hypothetical protein
MSHSQRRRCSLDMDVIGHGPAVALPAALFTDNTAWQPN